MIQDEPRGQQALVLWLQFQGLAVSLSALVLTAELAMRLLGRTGTLGLGHWSTAEIGGATALLWLFVIVLWNSKPAVRAAWRLARGFGYAFFVASVITSAGFALVGYPIAYVLVGLKPQRRLVAEPVVMQVVDPIEPAVAPAPEPEPYVVPNFKPNARIGLLDATGYDDEGEVLTTLVPAGTPVRILSNRIRTMEVQAADGWRGWVDARMLTPD